MRVEVLVFRGQEGVLHEWRDRAARKIETTLARIFRQNGAISAMNSRHDRRLIILELRGVWQILLEMPDERTDGNRANDENNRPGSEYETKKSREKPHLFLPCRQAKVVSAIETDKMTNGTVRHLSTPGLETPRRPASKTLRRPRKMGLQPICVDFAAIRTLPGSRFAKVANRCRVATIQGASILPGSESVGASAVRAGMPVCCV